MRIDLQVTGNAGWQQPKYNSSILGDQVKVSQYDTIKTIRFYFTSPVYTAATPSLQQSVNPGFLLDRYI